MDTSSLKPRPDPSPPSAIHWADQAAQRVVAAKPGQTHFVVASGITPSGTVHIGNFREVITVDFVARALMDLGHSVRFIYSWDDFDTFRKVPKNLPNQAMLTQHLRKPISHVPDPWGKERSYAAANIRPFENDLSRVGICPEYIYQHERYGDGKYAQQIYRALQQKDLIRQILDQHRTEPLDSSWLPTTIYCQRCLKDILEDERYLGEWQYTYRCKSCGHQETLDIRQAKFLKLAWRTDWPMRWAFEKVDFEPGGKEHSSAGGSYDTAKEIVRRVWERDPPIYQQYDFVMKKGGTGKMSSSQGDLLTLTEALEVYEPAMVRWLFAVQRPNHDFPLAFDVDVIKAYEEYDRCVLRASEPKPSADHEDGDAWQRNRRIFELSQVRRGDFQSHCYRAPFRDLCMHLQIAGGDIDRTIDRFYQQHLKSEDDSRHLRARAQCAITWLDRYAPAEFQYRLRSVAVHEALQSDFVPAYNALLTLLRQTDMKTTTGEEFGQRLYAEVIKKHSVSAKDFFRIVYQRLIGRDQGPRLGPFLVEMGQGRALELLDPTSLPAEQQH